MKLAWKEVRYNWRKYLLIEFLLILMIFMVMFLSGLANGLARAVSAGIENSEATYFLVGSDAENLITVSRLDEKQLEEVNDLTDSKAAALNISRMNLNKKGDSEKLDVTYFALDTEGFLNPKVKTGDMLSYETHEIVLDDAFEEEGISLGDTILDTSSGIELTVVGFTKDAMYGHISIGYINMDTYKDIQTANNPQYVLQYQTIALQDSNASNLSFDEIDVVDKATIVKNIPGYQAEQTTINMILWVLVFVSAAILGVFFYIITLQKHKQFGIMKAIGMEMGEIIGIQFAQVMLLAGIGVLSGNVLTFAMALMLPNSMPFYLDLMSTVIVSLAFIIIVILGSLVSARHIAKVDPVKIIGGNEE